VIDRQAGTPVLRKDKGRDNSDHKTQTFQGVRFIKLARGNPLTLTLSPEGRDETGKEGDDEAGGSKTTPPTE
jgi:hypothetical protein